MGSEPIPRRSRLAIGVARGMSTMMVTTLFRGGMLLGMLLIAISGAASPWGGEEESQLASHQSSLANNGVHSVMKRGAAGEVKKRKSEKKSGSKTEKKKKGKQEKSVKKGKNRKGKKTKGEKGKLEKGKKKKKSKNGKKRNGGKSKS